VLFRSFIEIENSLYSLKNIKSQSKTDSVERFVWNTDREGMEIILTVALFDNSVEFHWQKGGKEGTLNITFDLSSAPYWYGQGELINQEWPLNKSTLPFGPFITSDNGPTGLGNIQTPLWWSSNGTGIMIPDRIPLLAGIGPDGLLRIGTEKEHLRVIIFTGKKIPESYPYFIKESGRPERTPSEKLLSLPIWTTWAFYKTEITQEKVLTFAGEIIDHSFPGGTLEIDDMWQSDYGDFSFHPHKFPDPDGMIRELHSMGFRVTLWITPFFNPSSKNFSGGSEKGYFIKGADGRLILFPWWHGKGALLNVMNREAMTWFKEELKELENIGIDGFKFDAGEASFLEKSSLPDRNNYSRLWVDFASENFPYGEVRTGWHNHTSGMLFRQWDKFSIWGTHNGLSSVITQALTMSLTGYPFILPDIIGGNLYGEEKISKDLMIRWTQVASLMPAMQFSFPPWMIDEETERICRSYAELHKKFSNEIIELAKEAALTGLPIIRPLFWSDPYDEKTYDISDEFLLGDKYLVAPVLCPGTESRNIYLPRGVWKDYWVGKEYKGPLLLTDYPAPPECLPIFVSID